MDGLTIKWLMEEGKKSKRVKSSGGKFNMQGTYFPITFKTLWD